MRVNLWTGRWLPTLLPAIVAVLLLGAPVHADAAGPAGGRFVVPPPDPIRVEMESYTGTGCPPGSASVAVDPDSTGFTVRYTKYTALVGVGATRTDFKKYCLLSLRIPLLPGFTYALAQADHRGTASLQSGAHATQQFSHYFGGQSAAYTGHPITGPLVDDWQTTEQIAWDALDWHPCGGLATLNVRTQLVVYAGTSDPTTTTSWISMNAEDGAVSGNYRLVWKRCPQR